MATALRLDVAHAVLHVHDVEAMIDFYSNVLGFEVTDRGPFVQGEIVFLSQSANDHHQVAFITGRDEPESSNSVHHVAFRTPGTLDDLKSLKKTLEADERVTQIMPLCHGNAWSVYFRDPEFNGVEVFLDTPWHVRQPQGQPLDLDKSNDEIIEATRSHFSTEPEFCPIDEFYASRRAPPAPPVVTGYGGSYRGVVVDNVDPMQQYRLQVLVPDVWPDGSVWAAPSSSGGTGSIPAVGDTVTITFEHGDSDYPIWQSDTGTYGPADSHGGYVGRYRGIVISNNDPMQENRLEVIVPDVDSSSAWALPSDDVRYSTPPEVGAEAWIEYDNGDPAYPRWVGSA